MTENMTELVLQLQTPPAAAAILCDGRLMDYVPLADAPQGPQPEEIYLGRVARVMKNIQALFVRIGEKAEGFLPFAEYPGPRPNPGDTVLVQVKKPPQGAKAAYLTGDIALGGRLAVLLPCGGAAHVSSRMPEEQKGEYLALAQRLAPPGMGLVLRSECALLQQEDIAAQIAEEVAILRARWDDVWRSAQSAGAPALLWGAPTPVQQLLRDSRGQVDRIIADDPPLASQWGVAAQAEAAPFARRRVAQQLQQARERCIPLKSGAALVIDPCEAMTVIDVNTAHFAHKGDRESAFLQVNIEAAAEIARILRLRRVGGIVVIDFIDMQQQAHRQQVLQALEQALLQDPAKCVVHGFTALGLVEMTRKRSQAHLPSQRCMPCPACQGTGVVAAQADAAAKEQQA